MPNTTSSITVGAEAPAFTFPGSSGPVGLADYRGRPVVLYFVREFSCPICQRHVARLVRLYPRLQGLGAEVLVIGPESREQGERMAARFQTPFPVVVDTDHAVYRRYGLDKGLLGIQRSATFVIDGAGRVRYANVATNPAAALDEGALLRAVEAVAADGAWQGAA